MNIKYPSTYIQLYSQINLILGVGFFISGVLNKIGIMSTSPNSKGDPSVIFTILGTLFLLVATVGLLFTYTKDRQSKTLFRTGIQSSGKITRLKKHTLTNWGNKSPVTACFTYSYDGVTYNGKSNLYWDTPPFTNGDCIHIYVDANKPANYLVHDKVV